MESGHDAAGGPPETPLQQRPRPLEPLQEQPQPQGQVQGQVPEQGQGQGRPRPLIDLPANAIAADTANATFAAHAPFPSDSATPTPQQQPPQQHDGSLVGAVASDRQRGLSGSTAGNVDPSDRVFPIRSVISVVDQPPPTPWTLSRDVSEADLATRSDATWDGRRRPSMARIATDALPTSPPPFSPSDRPVPGPRRARRNTVTNTTNTTNTTANTTTTATTTAVPSAVASPSLLPSPSMPSPSPSPSTSTPTALSDDRPRSITSTPQALTNGSSSGAGAGPSNSSVGDLPGLADDEALVTTRFRHVMTDDGHAIITGRDGTLQHCEDEPIHTPGAVQAFGLLVALREEADGRFVVRIVSENSAQIIGYSPSELFGLASVTEILSDEQADNLLDHIDFIRDEEPDPATSGPDVFSISLRPPDARPVKLWCAIHVHQSHPDLVICEFEPEDDPRYPIRPPDEPAPPAPEDTLYQSPTAEELQESTEVSSRPLRVLRSARKKRGEAGAMQVFDIMSQVQEQFATAPNLDKFLKILVGIVKELTGFHRVMIYQFDAAFNGKVVTELVDPTQTRDLYHGLHFPASDIPRQARELYKLNKVRLLYDRDLESARLVCRTVEDLEQPLDLSHAYLRAMSPIHLKYLANMAVRSSMSISINAFDELWGLISCHSYGSRGMRVSFPIRKMCRMVGDTASRNIERLSYASRLHARKLINTMPTDKNPSGYIVASSEDLLTLFDADFGMLSIGDETKVLGKISHSQEALALLEYLRVRNFTTVLTSQDINQDFPDLLYTPGFSVIAGLLYVPLSIGGHDFIVFFRKSQIKEVKWAGNPYEKMIKAGTSHYLEPRSSFKAWRETVSGQCREWSEDQVETAAVLCLVYGKFIEVWRQKEAALQSSRLTRLLLANSAHEVRTPLNAIINYLEIALEGSLDHETRENLAKSHSASKSLIYVINDLLDLTKAEEGRELIKDEIMNLPACIVEATEPFKADAKRKGISYEVIEHPGLPKYVHGDYRRVRQAIANVTANAVQNTITGSVKVECFVIEVLESQVRVEITVHDTGCGMSNEQLDYLFQDLEQVSSADFGEPDTVETPPNHPRKGRTLGLGLAVVARIVANMDGQLRLKSEEGKGSRFVIQVPFELPTSDALEKLGESDANAETTSDATTVASVTKSLPPAQTGEVMLIDRGSANGATPSNRPISKSRSFDETNSINSLKSAGSGGAHSIKSDADRLIDAIQTPVGHSEVEEDTNHVQRTFQGRRHHSNASVSSLPGSLVLQDSRVQPTTVAKHPLPTSSTDNGTYAEAQHGVHPVQDSNTPVKPVKVPDEYSALPTEPQVGYSSRVVYELPEASTEKDPNQNSTTSDTKLNELRVLIAEDDPVNMKILTKRLEKAGHTVYPAVNGEDCATIYEEKPGQFEVVLMDMQMPIVDGLTSTKLIRAFEKSAALSLRHRRIPIFAVSASLMEKDRAVYIEAGFDGWILKPIDFRRLHVLLDGITNEVVREQSLYEPGEWERGGWFVSRPTESSQLVEQKCD
ncbi:hsp90-like protein [Nemania sp. FL0916]|nr:hsp90-like protein [Nemania sp. FL0916]